MERVDLTAQELMKCEIAVPDSADPSYFIRCKVVYVEEEEDDPFFRGLTFLYLVAIEEEELNREFEPKLGVHIYRVITLNDIDSERAYIKYPDNE